MPDDIDYLLHHCEAMRGAEAHSLLRIRPAMNSPAYGVAPHQWG
jgi:hypothetical protein